MQTSAHAFLEGFTPAARQRLLDGIEPEEHADGSYLFHEGDAADGIYLILEGEVDIVRKAGQQEKVLGVVHAGDYLGEVAVLDGFGRSTAARARGELSVAKIPRGELLEVLASEPGTLTLALFRHVLGHLRRANDLVVAEVVHKEKLSLVGEMASSLMHDLRNPVSSIRLSADLITLTYPDSSPWCDGIRMQCDRLIVMAAELMEFSKGETHITLGKTTTEAFLDQFRSLNERSLEGIKVKITYDVKPAEIEIDALRMQRVLQNLVTNSIEALHATLNPVIEISASVENGSFALIVTDNGPGIPATIQERIFEPFVTHGKSGGTGLGMAIVRNIITAHGGSITFTTSAQGTTFTICLPQKGK